VLGHQHVREQARSGTPLSITAVGTGASCESSAFTVMAPKLPLRRAYATETQAPGDPMFKC
jgi:hypothetical protein